MIVIRDYDPIWHDQFQELREKLWCVVSDIAVSIEHVGSTSVPGLAAKPIIDLDIIVRSPEEVPMAINRLAPVDYVHRGNLGVEGREAFDNPVGSPDHNLYVCPAGSIGLRNHLAVRNHLRGNAEKVRAYGELKKSLAARYPNDIDAYIAGKSAFLLQILRDCGLSASDLKEIAAANQAAES